MRSDNPNRATILVTGATGAIGRHLVPALANAGYRVRAQFRTTSGHVPGVDWRSWDFLKGDDPLPLVAGCDAVIHLAAAIHERDQMDRVNVWALRELAHAADVAGVRYFAHASSIVVYGSPAHRDVDENTPLIDTGRPIEPQYRAEPQMRDYARTKVLGEQLFAEVAPKYRLDLLRPSVVVSPAQEAETLAWGTARKMLIRHRRTQHVRVADVAAAILHLLDRGLRDGGLQDRGRRAQTPEVTAYNICGEGGETYHDLFRRLAPEAGLSGVPGWLHVPVAADLAKDAFKHRSAEIRYPLGLLRISNARLRDAGFRFGAIPASTEAPPLAGDMTDSGGAAPQARASLNAGNHD